MRRALVVALAALAGCTQAAPLERPSVAPPLPATATAAARGTPAPATATPAATAREPLTPSRWQRIADIPTPRSEVAAAVGRDVVYVVGGFGGRDRVERYDPATGRWERVADLPHGVDHPMAAAITGRGAPGQQGIFVFGGNAGGASARSFLFDIDAGRWSELAPMPGPRAAGAAVAIGGKIFVVGGADGNRLVSPTYEYDIVTRSWRTVAAIPTPRDHLAAAELGGRACAVGGRRLSMSLNLAALECYDPASDRWESLPSAPTARGGVGAAVAGGRLYFIGGERPQGTFNEVEVYDPAARAWSRGPDLSTPRHGIGVAAVGSTVYVMSGGPTPGGSQTAVCEALAVR